MIENKKIENDDVDNGRFGVDDVRYFLIIIYIFNIEIKITAICRRDSTLFYAIP